MGLDFGELGLEVLEFGIRVADDSNILVYEV